MFYIFAQKVLDIYRGIYYNNIRKEVRTLSKNKKSGNKAETLAGIVNLVTAIANLVTAILLIADKLSR